MSTSYEGWRYTIGFEVEDDESWEQAYDVLPERPSADHQDIATGCYYEALLGGLIDFEDTCVEIRLYDADRQYVAGFQFN